MTQGTGTGNREQGTGNREQGINDAKTILLENLANQTYARVKRSPIHGIGVFAIKDIPQGVDPFNRPTNLDFCLIKLTKDDLKTVDESVFQYLIDVVLFKDGCYHVPDFGLNGIDISWLMNHSDSPNIILAGEKLDEIQAMRKIEKGEELLVDYRNYNENLEEFDFL